ncbi:MAG TPA: long-chain fatty acid--CoA ligase [Clostridiales bacterium]|nr:long-chain fatty acid--CoA ligase [Clostridiales bacterium]
MNDISKFTVCKSLNEIMLLASELYGNIPLTKTLKENGIEELTYKEVINKSKLLALHIHEKFGSGKNMVMIGDINYEWIVVFFAIILSNNVVVPLDHSLDVSIIIKQLDHLEAELVFCSDNNSSLYNNDLLKNVQIIKFTDFINEIYDVMNFDIVNNYENNDPNSVAMIVYTSGTTGELKGVMLTHKNIVTAIKYSTEIMGHDTFSSGDTIIPLLPPFHMFQITTGLLTPLLYGVSICFIGNIKNIAKGLLLFQPSILIVVPMILIGLRKMLRLKMSRTDYFKFQLGLLINRLLRRVKLDVSRLIFKELHKKLGGKLRTIVCGGAFVEENLVDWYKNIGIQVFVGYGITECSPVVACNRIKATKKHSVGKCIEQYCQVKIEDNEILLKGDIVFLKYYKNERATKEAFVNGWFRTGDLGYVDKEGYLFISGRRKNLIVGTDGNNVSPEELEQLLESYELISDALVYLKRIKGNQFIVADVLLNNEMTKKLSSSVIETMLLKIKNDINNLLPSYKRIASIRQISQSFEKNHLGKILRYKYIKEDGTRFEK